MILGALTPTQPAIRMPGTTAPATPTCPAGQQYVPKMGQCVKVTTPVVIASCTPPLVGSAGKCWTRDQIVKWGHPEYDPQWGFTPKIANAEPHQTTFDGLVWETDKKYWRNFVPMQDSVYSNLIPALVPPDKMPGGGTFWGQVLRTRTSSDPPAGTPRHGVDYPTLWAEDVWPKWFFGAVQDKTQAPDLSGNGKPLGPYDAALYTGLIASLQKTDPQKAAAVQNGSMPFSYADLTIADDGSTTTGVMWTKYFGPATNNVLAIQSSPYSHKDTDPIAWLKDPLKTMVTGAQAVASAVGACTTAGKMGLTATGSSGTAAASVLCPTAAPPPSCVTPLVYDTTSKTCINAGGAVYPMGTIARFNTTHNVWSVYVPQATAGLGTASTAAPKVTPPAPAGTSYAGQSPTQPPGTINGGTERDIPIYGRWQFWAALGGTVAVVGTGAYLVTRRRKPPR